MEVSKYLSLCGLIVGTTALSLALDTSYILALPSHSAAVIFSFLGIFVLFVNTYLPQLLRPSEHAPPPEYELPALGISTTQQRSRLESPIQRLRDPTVIGLIGVIVWRIELLRRLVAGVQCSVPNFGALILIPVAIYPRVISSSQPRDRENVPAPHTLADYSRRYILPALFVASASTAIAFKTAPERSTYICSTAASSSIVAIQCIGVLLDTLIIILLDRLLHQDDSSNVPGSRLNSSLPPMFLASSALTFSLGGYVYVAYPLLRPWLLAFPPGYFQSLPLTCCMLGLSLICALQLTIRFSIPTVVLIVTSVSTCTRSMVGSWSGLPNELAISLFSALFFFGLLYVGVYLTYIVETGHGPERGQPPRSKGHATKSPWPYSLLALLFLQILPYIRDRPLGVHPITLLMRSAKEQHTEWIIQAGQSRNLGEAVANYQKRYNRNPPPGFDKWYDFAMARGSLIIDDFDTINDDLAPFWSLSPQELRERTWKMTANPWNDVFPLKIRNGKVDLGMNRLATHRWMLEGTEALFHPFIGHIPDMDLAMNPNDECRVAVDWKTLEASKRRRKEAVTNHVVDPSWTNARGSQWKDPDKEPFDSSNFADSSFFPSYHTYLSQTCPPGSRARNDFVWNTRNLCDSCAAPHSFGPFVKDWPLATDSCHQPDLAHLHGFFISPAAFRVTRELVPIFSQSRVKGYNDILYPSPWNYIGKVKYEPSDEFPDPEFSKKNSSLFWRGATSEGVSANGAWQGMARQRFVYTANSSHSTSTTPLLVTDPKGSTARLLSHVPISNPSLPKTDVGVVSEIVRCVDADCSNEANDLNFRPSVDFQAHWGYKYLMDLDGGGFSGRFLPFLKSQSLPFKTALFTEWHADRLMPWLHFVPQDLRLHGLYSTLAYFAGMTGKINGKVVDMKPHEEEAKWIAEQGRNWAQRALRNEDMEIYMFRLLLEWGRLTDDKRDKLGFILEDKTSG